jgi:hypothetical protein
VFPLVPLVPTGQPDVPDVPPDVLPEVPEVPPDVFPDVPLVPPEVLPDVPLVPPDVLPDVLLVPPEVLPDVPLVPPEVLPDVPLVPPDVFPDVPLVPPEVAACPWMSAQIAHASTLQFTFGRPLAVAVQPPPDPGTPGVAGTGFVTCSAVRGSELLPGLIAAPPPIAFLPLGQLAVAVLVTVLLVLTARTYSTART